jgi:hypothetical protein
MRRLPSSKEVKNQSLTDSVLKPRSREVWRKTGPKREFRGSAGAAQCVGLCAKPAVIGDFSAPKSSGERWSRKDWRRGRDSNPRYGYPYAAFRVRCIQPLCHLSAARPGLKKPQTDGRYLTKRAKTNKGRAAYIGFRERNAGQAGHRCPAPRNSIACARNPATSP